MKRNTFLLWMLALWAGISTMSAYDAKVGNFCYNFSGTNATVTYYDYLLLEGKYNNPYYVGIINIPSTVTYNGMTYNVTAIGDHAFQDCSHLNVITIPNSVTSIGKEAFSGCNSSYLTSITIPESVTSIGANAFDGCTSLTSVHINDLAAWCNIAFSISASSNPLYYAHHLFINDTEVTDLVIPNSVTSISQEAFCGCFGLTSVTIPESVTSIGWGAFDGCTGLTSVHINDLAIWFNISFNGSRANPLYRANHLFINNTEVTDLVIPSGITSISQYAFEGWSSLTSITIPNSVTSIDKSAFYNCSGLTSVTIPNSVTSIGWTAFFGCSGLTSVTIPNSVTTIENNAFSGCSGLTSVKSQIQVPFNMPSGCFNNISSNCVLTIPVGTRDAYIAKGWTTDVFQGGIEEYGFEAIDADGNMVGLPLDYADDQNNTVTLLDTYRSLTVPQDVPLKQISYVRNFGNTSWQSLYVPFEIPVTAQLLEEFEFAYINGAKQYDDNNDGVPDRLTIESFKVKSGTLKANNPYIIRAKTTGEKTITVNEATLYATAANSIDCSTTTLLFTFQGSYTKLNYEDMVDCYLLGGGTWNPTASGNTMKPMRFYMKVTSRGNNQVISSAPSIRLQIDGEMTDIEASPISSPEGTDIILDLQGRPIENPEKGIYIINGKKTVVR